MFISSHLFQTASPGHANFPHGGMDDAHNSQCGNSVLGKRRRNDVHDESIDVSDCLPRKVRPPLNLKTTITNDGIAEISLPSPPFDHADHDVGLHSFEARAKGPVERKDAPPPAKTRRRVASLKKTQITAPMVTIIPPSVTHQAKQIAPCHICHSSPRLVTDLHRYVDCELCYKRTCVICIRKCEARCGGRKVCGSCCIEKGKDGDAHCLDCLHMVEDHEMEG